MALEWAPPIQTTPSSTLRHNRMTALPLETRSGNSSHLIGSTSKPHYGTSLDLPPNSIKLSSADNNSTSCVGSSFAKALR
jgi:hypothetical protein